MTSVGDFLHGTALLFSNGDLVEASGTLKVPTTVHLGTRHMTLKTRGDVLSMLEIYRQNLMTEGYGRTELDILHTEEDGPNRARVFLTWRNLNTKGALISQVDASYFCDRDETGSWQMSMIETLNEPHTRLASGLPIV